MKTYPKPPPFSLKLSEILNVIKPKPKKKAKKAKKKATIFRIVEGPMTDKWIILCEQGAFKRVLHHNGSWRKSALFQKRWTGYYHSCSEAIRMCEEVNVKYALDTGSVVNYHNGIKHKKGDVQIRLAGSGWYIQKWNTSTDGYSSANRFLHMDGDWLASTQGVHGYTGYYKTLTEAEKVCQKYDVKYTVTPVIGNAHFYD